MKVILADAMGMCFGVRDALKQIDRVSHPQQVTIHGELVHNQQVLTQIESRGFATTKENDCSTLPATPLVMLTAHGISGKERQRLLAADKKLIDTTCPLVTHVHESSRELECAGFHVLIIGRRGHVEVQGIIDDLVHFDVIERVDEVRTYPSLRLGIISQSTSASRQIEAVRAMIESRNPHAEIRWIDTICQPTKDRQQAVERLARQVDSMIVVGGRNSNNTRQLVNYCQEQAVPVHHVQIAADLRREWFVGCEIVGLTAGTSTLQETIDEVHETLLNLSPGGAQ